MVKNTIQYQSKVSPIRLKENLTLDQFAAI